MKYWQIFTFCIPGTNGLSKKKLMPLSVAVPGRLSLDVGQVLELELHGGDVVPWLGDEEVLDVLVEVPGGHLSVPRQHGLKVWEEGGIYQWHFKKKTCVKNNFSSQPCTFAK